MKHIREKSTKELVEISEDAIDYSDIPPLTKEFWKRAKVRIPSPKQLISVRLDDDIVKWFKGQGKGYQSYMNAVLRSFVDSHVGQ